MYKYNSSHHAFLQLQALQIEKIISIFRYIIYGQCQYAYRYINHPGYNRSEFNFKANFHLAISKHVYERAMFCVKSPRVLIPNPKTIQIFLSFIFFIDIFLEIDYDILLFQEQVSCIKIRRISEQNFKVVRMLYQCVYVYIHIKVQNSRKQRLFSRKEAISISAIQMKFITLNFQATCTCSKTLLRICAFVTRLYETFSTMIFRDMLGEVSVRISLRVPNHAVAASTRVENTKGQTRLNT